MALLWLSLAYEAALSWLPQQDVRSEGWPLTGSPVPVAIITAFYVYFVKIFGPRMMLHRKPYELKLCILAYNLLTTLLSAFFLVRFAKLAYWDLGYTFLQEQDLGVSPANLEIVRLSWWLYLFKLGELADTVFFVLRKKNDQVSTLHVVHHLIVSWNMWLAVTYGAQYHSMFVICLNSLVHVIMYAYYFLSALGPSFRRFLWWKRYLTQMQLGQFVLLFAHAIGTVFATGNYVRLFSWLEMAQAVLFFVLFTSFYANAYTKNKKP
ncbi:very long chain fatty acid elongase 7-like [Dermacentor albipictus]|uniref:very long chain fatty acid elongase 7-like n=1 Tax=Dermacentor albipictus TaxID=60249 RepID=UPI0031FD576F